MKPDDHTASAAPKCPRCDLPVLSVEKQLGRPTIYRHAGGVHEDMNAASLMSQLTDGRLGHCTDCGRMIRGGDGLCGDCMGSVWSDD